MKTNIFISVGKRILTWALTPRILKKKFGFLFYFSIGIKYLYVVSITESFISFPIFEKKFSKATLKYSLLMISGEMTIQNKAIMLNLFNKILFFAILYAHALHFATLLPS